MSCRHGDDCRPFTPNRVQATEGADLKSLTYPLEGLVLEPVRRQFYFFNWQLLSGMNRVELRLSIAVQRYKALPFKTLETLDSLSRCFWGSEG